MPKVLIVDDEFIERKGLMMLFNQKFLDQDEDEEKIILMEAENGRDALSVLMKEKPDILLTDIRMPFMDGISLISSAKEVLPDLVTIIISAYGEFEYAQAAIECKVSHYMLKPVSPDEFERVISKALGEVPKKKKSIRGSQKETRLKSELTSVDMNLRKKSADRVIRDVLNILQNEYMEILSVDDIAERVFLSTSYLSYIFKKYTGQTIMKYLTDLKLEKAREILVSGNMKITDVATAVGYRDISYFCSQFKGKFGMTPTQFRNNLDME